MRFARCPVLPLAKFISLVTFIATSAGCAIGHQFAYGGETYTMTQANIDYFEKAQQDIDALKAQDPGTGIQDSTPPSERVALLERKIALQRTLCERIQQYASGSPDGSGFTPASELLKTEFSRDCSPDVTMRLERELEAAHRDVKASEIAGRRAAIDAIVQQCSSGSPADCTVPGITDAERADCARRCDEAVKAQHQREAQQRWDQVVAPLLSKCESPQSVLDAPRASVSDEATKFSRTTCAVPELNDDERNDCAQRCEMIALLARAKKDGLVRSP